MKPQRRLAALLLATAVWAGPALAETIAIVGGTVATVANPVPMANATILIENGRIRAVGTSVAVPPGATVIDATGKIVTPGIIAGMSYIGLSEVNAVDETNEVRAPKSPFSAGLDLAPGINAAASNIAVERQGGITRAVVGPIASHEIFGGMGAVVTLAAGPDIVERPRAFEYVELGEAGAEAAGGSRPAAWANFRNALKEAERLARSPAAYADGRDKEAIIPRLDVEALVPVIRGTMPLVVHVERASDILNVLKIRDEFAKVRLILLGANEGWLVADKIAAAHVPVVTMPMVDLPASFETLASTKSNVGRMVAAGVVVGLGITAQDASFQARDLPNYAGNLVAQARVPGGVGLTQAQALAVLTRNPATIFGLTDTGTIEVGKRADIVVWDGDPLELESAPVAVLIDGVRQPMTSRQTDLRDRYLHLPHADLPLQYRR